MTTRRSCCRCPRTLSSIFICKIQKIEICWVILTLTCFHLRYVTTSPTDADLIDYIHNASPKQSPTSSAGQEVITTLLFSTTSVSLLPPSTATTESSPSRAKTTSSPSRTATAFFTTTSAATTSAITTSAIFTTAKGVPKINPSILTDQQLILAGPKFTSSSENITTVIEGSVTFRCYTSGSPPPRIKWFKDGIAVETDASKRIGFSAAKRNLILRNVQWEDRGSYICKARNSQGTAYSSPNILYVERPVAILRGVESRIVSSGTVVNSTCEVVGYPQPVIFWEVDGFPQYEKNVLYSRQYYAYNATRTHRLACKTMNRGVNGMPTRKQSVGTITVSNPSSYCADYNGYNCDSFGLGRVYFNATLDNFGGAEVLLTNFVSTLGSSPKRLHQCHYAFLSLLCHFVFPDCKSKETAVHSPEPLSLCQEDCLVIKDLTCVGHWQDLLRIQNPYLFQLYESLVFPDCPAYLSEDTSDGQCTHTGLYDIPKSMRTTVNCMENRGIAYNGQMNVTENGQACQDWDQETYRNAGIFPEVFTVLQNASNYCRNPGGFEARLWCFVEIGSTEKQFCDIPNCDDLPAQTSTQTQTVSIRNVLVTNEQTPRVPLDEGSMIAYVSINEYAVITVSSMMILLVITAIICFSIRKVKYLKKYPPYTFPSGFDIKSVPDNPMFGKTFTQSFNPHLESLEYPRNDIIFLADIGEGAFGRVFKASVIDPSSADSRMVVAVKTLKSSASHEVVENFNREAVLMSKFSNINVIKLWGVCFVGKPLCLLLEYMERGDLQEFLQLQNPLNPQFFDKEDGKKGLSLKLQVSLARQVANGMMYLCERRLVHRDVATRNCVINANLQVKISDFGLARYLRTEDFYLGSKEEKLPVRWTAPEALWHYQFTVHSDVWSFGVFMWELFSYAEQPYVGMTLEQVFMKTQEGHQLPCPEDTPPNIFEIIQSCWQLHPDSRPSFQTLCSKLNNWERIVLRSSRTSTSSF